MLLPESPKEEQYDEQTMIKILRKQYMNKEELQQRNRLGAVEVLIPSEKNISTIHI